MIRYVLRRLILLIPVIICVSFIVYALVDLAPGSVIDAMITEGMTDADIEELRIRHNLHRPMIYRYGLYMLNLIQGDLGVSDITGLSVWNLFMSRLPNTLILALGSLIIGVTISIPMGVFAARRSGKFADTATTTFTMIGVSMPMFWMGLLLIMLFSYHLGWFPASGNRHGFSSIVLPSLCGGLMMMASSMRQTRSSMLDVLKSDYLRTARAKGVPEGIVVRKHALNNALIPIITTVGGSLAFQLGGAVVIEQVFAWPGIGRLTVEAVSSRDVTLTLGAVIMSTIIYVLVLLIVDLVYAFVDPRIKAQYIGRSRKKKPSTIKKVPSPAVAAISAADIQDMPVLVNEDMAETYESDTAAEAAQCDHEKLIYRADGFQAVERKGDTINEAAHAKGAKTPESAPCNNVAEPGIIKAPELYENVKDKYKKRSQLADIWHMIIRSRSAVTGMVLLGLVLAALIGSLFITWESVIQIDMQNRLAPVSWQFPFGTDSFGRNMFLRVIYGTRYSVTIAFGASVVAAIVGIFLGAIAGYFGKAADEIIMRFSDILASIPGILLGMVIMITIGTSLQNLIFAVGVNAVPGFIRMTRASILTVRDNEYVEAARAMGLPNKHIIFRQVLPNGLSPIIVTFTLNLGMSIIIASSLSFLGFGIPAPTPEWGVLIAGAREVSRGNPHLMLFPGLFIMLTVLSFNLLGDGLRDALDPKLKK